MRARYLLLAVGLALVAAACGAGAVDSTAQQSSDQVGSAPQVTTSSSESNPVATTTSEALTTTSQLLTTTTTTAAPTTASTSAAAPPAAGTLAAFLASDGGRQAITSGRFELTLTLVPGPDAEFDEPVTMLISGAYDDDSQSSEMTMDLSGMTAMVAAGDEGSEIFVEFFADPLRIISIGDRSWVKWGFFSAFLGAGDKWIEGESEGSGGATQSLGLGSVGFTPTDFIGALEGADVDVEEVGSEDVRGVQTTKYRAVLDLVALSNQLTPDELADLEEAIGEGAPAEFPIEMWIDSDGELRRFSLEVASTELMPEGDQLDSATLLFEMWDNGEDVNIVPPDPADVLAGDELGFGFGLDG